MGRLISCIGGTWHRGTLKLKRKRDKKREKERRNLFRVFKGAKNEEEGKEVKTWRR